LNGRASETASARRAPSIAQAVELVVKRTGDDAEGRQRVDPARLKAIGKTFDNVVDTLDDNTRLDIFTRVYLTASGPDRQRILSHPVCPTEDEILADIKGKLARLRAE
jgi:hypothetical protein